LKKYSGNSSVQCSISLPSTKLISGSASVSQGNPTLYEWDFNSDGLIDSTEPHPEFTYQIEGIYDVTLTVYDETGSDTQTKENYIQVVSDILFGDVDQSGVLDVIDLVLFVSFVLGDAEPTEDQFLAGDVNYSGQIDIIDIVMVINEILH
jgi:PKD repeat protein